MAGYYTNQHGEPVGQYCEKCKKPIWYSIQESKMEDGKLVHTNCKEQK